MHNKYLSTFEIGTAWSETYTTIGKFLTFIISFMIKNIAHNAEIDSDVVQNTLKIDIENNYF